MKIVIAGGKDRADFLIGFLLKKKHHLVVINDSAEFCKYLATMYEIPVICGDPCKQYILDEAHISHYDVLIALTPSDADNLAICQCAKRVFSVKKVVCTVSNPKNVDVFKRLGVNTVISATYMISQYIEQATTIENLIKALSFEDEGISMSEITIIGTNPCVGRMLMELRFPQGTIIACIIRKGAAFVPNAQTVILDEDKLLIVSSSKDNDAAAIKMLTGQ